jgi:23S rRNA (cytosine1962-C5)-methyltransferase
MFRRSSTSRSDSSGFSDSRPPRDRERRERSDDRRDGRSDYRRDDRRDFRRDDRRDDRRERPSYFSERRDSDDRRDYSSRRPRREEEDDFTARPPVDTSTWVEPWVQMKYYSNHPSIFPRMVGRTSSQIAPGSLVHVYDKEGQPFASAFFNDGARAPLRIISHGATPLTEDDLLQKITQAVSLRREWLRLDGVTTAYRVIHSDADGLPGLIVDRYGDTLSVEVSTLGVWQRLERWLPHLHSLLGTKEHTVQVDEHVAEIEDIRQPHSLQKNLRPVRIIEHGVKYDVDFEEGHKTGFFCDQRDNRLKLSQLCHGKNVLDLCCYSGGFSLAAKVLGGAHEVTAVDLDEKAIAQAKRNANANMVRIQWTHSDAFDYARQMIANQRTFDVVICDPPKFIHTRDEEGWELGRRKYNDLNALAMALVAPGGLFVTCSCSGLISVDQFESLVIAAAHRHHKKLQIIDRTGPGADHPVMSNCPESRYLKVLWALVHY